MTVADLFVVASGTAGTGGLPGEKLAGRTPPEFDHNNHLPRAFYSTVGNIYAR